MKFYTFILNFGYVETAAFSYLPFTSSCEFEDDKSALIDLANFLKDSYLDLKFNVESACCTDAKKSDSSARYCRTCGRELVKKESFNGEDFTDWLVQMGAGASDSQSFHSEFVGWQSDLRWEPGVFEMTNGDYKQVFVYNAEWVLAAAVGYNHVGYRTFDNLCEDRVKKNESNFSYW